MRVAHGVLIAMPCGAALDALNYLQPVRNRRYPLVDEERGLVWAIALLDMQASSLTPDTEERLVRGG